NTFKYIASTLKLHSRTDVFFLCMRESITSFYRSLGQPHLAARNDQAFRLVDLCSDLGARAAAAAIKKAPASPVLSSIKHCDVLVIGGTGFIGRHLVAALSTQGKRVAVMARNVRRLPPVFNSPNVILIRGDATKWDEVRAAIGTAGIVIHLAHGGGS